MDIEGALTDGASILTLSPASATALTVVCPNAAIRVLFCSNSGKF